MDEPEEENYSRLDAMGEEAYEILFDTGLSITEYEKKKAGSKKRNLTEYKLRYAIEAAEQ